MKKFIKIFLLTIAAVLVVAIGYIFITFPPVMAGMAAKTMCSCVFLTGRDPQSVKDKELQVLPENCFTGFPKYGSRYGGISMNIYRSAG